MGDPHEYIRDLSLPLVRLGALLWTGWRVVRDLRQTVYFPIAFAIWWYAVILLVLLMYFGIVAYQNFVNNAYMWLLIGILILVALKLRGSEEWLQKAGEIVGERRETPEEMAHRSAI